MGNNRDDDAKPAKRKSLHWELAKRDMAEEELATIRNMNWEWYYNCFLYKDEPVEVTCKICGFMNIFLPGEKSKKCVQCGIECRRCEVDEEEK
ncbi:MAG: hypothetical protein VB050_13895 [Geobacteraceae bacterium]|nr:hypothetical protein [Geobacteraceae bacterium]